MNGGVVALAIWLASSNENAFNSYGEFGDFVGGLANPLLALLGFMALLYTIKLQLNELSLSRQELSLTREELQRSASALEAQVSHLQTQRLSQAFFDIFDMYKSVVSEMDFGHKENRSTGKAALSKQVSRFYPYAYMSNNPLADGKGAGNAYRDESGTGKLLSNHLSSLLILRK